MGEGLSHRPELSEISMGSTNFNQTFSSKESLVRFKRSSIETNPLKRVQEKSFLHSRWRMNHHPQPQTTYPAQKLSFPGTAAHFERSFL